MEKMNRENEIEDSHSEKYPLIWSSVNQLTLRDKFSSGLNFAKSKFSSLLAKSDPGKKHLQNPT